VRRRVQLPGASELFRMSTGPAGATAVEVIGGTSASERSSASNEPDADPGMSPITPLAPRVRAAAAGRTPSGRQRHDEKITVYLSSGELLELERTRLELRARHGVGIDRGRIVREAIAIALADFEEHGASSVLIRRLAVGH
jgi:hypothetical protein